MQAFAQLTQDEADNAADLILAERFEDDNVIHTVQEFRTEELHQHTAHFFMADFTLMFHDFMGSEVARHDDEGILEVDDTALAIGQAAIIKDLEEDVEDVGMSFFDFIKKDNRIRMTAHGFRELTPFFIAYISRRRTNQAAYGMLFHIFTHIDADNALFIVEEHFRKALGKFRLADARRAQEDKGTNGLIGILDAGTSADNGFGDSLHGFILTDDPLMEDFIQVSQFLLFTFHKAAHRDPRPGADDFGDIVFVDFFLEKTVFCMFFFFQFLELFLQFRQTAILEFGKLVEIIVVLGRFHVLLHLVNGFLDLANLGNASLFFLPASRHLIVLCFHLFQFLTDLFETVSRLLIFFFGKGLFLNLELKHTAAAFIQFRRHGINFRTQTGCRFVDKVDGLIRQEPFTDIAV